jgi:hypothetical protein
MKALNGDSGMLIITALEYETSLSGSNWTQLLNFTLSADPFEFFDTTAAGSARRFYRAYAH